MTGHCTAKVCACAGLMPAIKQSCVLWEEGPWKPPEPPPPPPQPGVLNLLQPGLAPRDHFAIAALPGVISVIGDLEAGGDIACLAYGIADAMMERRKR
jgi:hypothetical protein